MTEAAFEWRTYKYFPYERDFAKLEVERLFNTLSREDALGLRIPSLAYRAERAERLTYFARAVHPKGSVVVPWQARLEATANLDERVRQATRYSAHGLHEYKGRFNPQVVRAIGNILGLEEGASVLDPFCGGGTTLLECAHAGWTSVGIDRNPLAVRIANAKVWALRRARGVLQEMATAVVATLSGIAAPLTSSTPPGRAAMDRFLGHGWEGELPCFMYLEAWFPRAVLAQVVTIRRALHTHLRSAKDRAVFEIILSDLLRNASLQEPADLRIRRRKDPQRNYPLIEWFLEALPDRLKLVERARLTLKGLRGTQRALLGDVRTANLRRVVGFPSEGFAAVITSPPYETALPYIDTQRLSLVLLGDIKASDVQATEKALIGAREVSSRERLALEEVIRKGDSSLPSPIIELCRELLAAARTPGNGFRRVNRPALVYRYFKNMAYFFVNIRNTLRPGAPVALVVGTSRTVLGGREYVIETPRLLSALAQHCGYSLAEERPMDTYPRYDIHQRNSIDSEMLIVVEAP